MRTTSAKADSPDGGASCAAPDGAAETGASTAAALCGSSGALRQAASARIQPDTQARRAVVFMGRILLRPRKVHSRRDMPAPRDTLPPDPGAPAAARTARLALAVLVAVYAFNFLDRQLLSILAERLRADLGLDDADLGFLYGTAFAVFYAVCGLPLARLADAVDRRRLMAACLLLWSAATCASALAGSFTELAV